MTHTRKEALITAAIFAALLLLEVGVLLYAQGPSQHSITLGWTAYVQGSPAATGIKVYRSAASGGPYTLLTTTALPITSTKFIDLNCPGGSRCFYVLTATDAAADESGPSTEVSAVMPTNPNAPTGVTAIGK